MSLFDRTEARREVQYLDRLAMDARAEGHFATMERLLERAVETAEQLGDLPLLIKERYWYSLALQMQCKTTQAIGMYTWLIGLATDPGQSGGLSDDATLWYLASAFPNFLECSRFLPELPVDRLFHVAADGLAWLDRIGKPHWAAGLRNERAMLYVQRGETNAARRDLEAALALARRHPERSWLSLSAHRIALVNLLQYDRGARAEAAELIEETLEDPGSEPLVRCQAFEALARARQSEGDIEGAEEAAYEALEVARQMEAPGQMTAAYETLGRVQLDAGRLEAAVQTFARRCRLLQVDGRVQSGELALFDCARLRLEQARRACGIANSRTALSRPLPSRAERPLAMRRLRSARRFLDRARPLAEQLDRAGVGRSYVEEVEGVTRQVDRLSELLDHHPVERAAELITLTEIGESLFWMSRYLERAKNVARMLAVGIDLGLEDAGCSGHASSSLVDLTLRMLACRDALRLKHPAAERTAVLNFLTFDRTNPQSIRSMVASAHENARRTQQSIGADVWNKVDRLSIYLGDQRSQRQFHSNQSGYYTAVKSSCILIERLIQRNLPHDGVYHFLLFGRYLERANLIGRILHAACSTLRDGAGSPDADVEHAQWTALLNGCSAFGAYVRTERKRVVPFSVIRFLVFDPVFPRAIHFCVARCRKLLNKIGRANIGEFAHDAERLTGKLESDLLYIDAGWKFECGPLPFLDGILATTSRVGEEIQRSYFPT